ncbi:MULTISPECIES: ABC transporter ATP-binding protein [Herbaspirillum]|jgi:branched-chain amino acid transport system ATP-binding protein|uniref:ABC transporter ATP-binding protein n=1 Tax=Herbaspirillum TaxID=963 RepID=UPI0012ACCF24|nr:MULTISPECIES: ABC transporter ATP-binding protein [Herbaspirillum]MBW9332303.1 ABC transporter ATP-binding protein [Herbaspirillum sp. RU 5E]MRT29396.1 ABC transporter ATP-binding protein [Herbaspirillum sp. CAH-3]
MSALLQTRGLQLAFGGVVVADSIDFELQQGERLAVIGQNGAGKTTFINICTGFIRPTGGSVHFDGRDITRMAPRAIVQRGIGRSFQLPQLFLEHTVRDCIRLAAAGRSGLLRLWTPLARVLPDGEIDRILELVGLRERADDLCALLPEGQRKLLDIAMALVLQPKLLIMDEPTSGVSTEEKHGLMAIIMRVLDEQKITSIFVEHDVDIVTRYATRVAAWIAGRIAADGQPAEVLGNPEIRRNVIGE